MPDFNPRSREGSDVVRLSSAPDVEISIHAPVKGATKFEGHEQVFLLISIHAPVKGATFTWTGLPDSIDISIHAPVKGATDDRPFRAVHDLISIHAPVKGATAQ